MNTGKNVALSPFRARDTMNNSEMKGTERLLSSFSRKLDLVRTEFLNSITDAMEPAYFISLSYFTA